MDCWDLATMCCKNTTQSHTIVLHDFCNPARSKRSINWFWVKFWVSSQNKTLLMRPHRLLHTRLIRVKQLDWTTQEMLITCKLDFPHNTSSNTDMLISFSLFGLEMTIHRQVFVISRLCTLEYFSFFPILFPQKYENTHTRSGLQCAQIH